MRDLVLAGNEVTGVQLRGAGGAGAFGITIRNNRVEGNGGGIALLSGTTGALVADNALRANSGAHLLVRDSDENRLERNSVAGEGGGDLGIGLEHASRNTVIQNTVTATSDGGLVIEAGAHDNRVERNTLTATGDAGIVVDLSDRNRLIGNVAHEMSDSGIALGDANGGLVRGQRRPLQPRRHLDRRLQRQRDRGQRRERLDRDRDRASATARWATTVLRNRANGNGAQGIVLAGDAEPGTGNLVAFNAASDNAADGIVVAKGAHVVTANAATGNGGWGISVAPETVDGGLNVATGNREPGQCAGIVCIGAPQQEPPDEVPPETVLDPAPETSDGSIEFSFDADRRRPLRVPARRGRLGGLHVAVALHRADARTARVRGACDRRRGQRRSDPGRARVDRRARRHRAGDGADGHARGRQRTVGDVRVHRRRRRGPGHASSAAWTARSGSRARARTGSRISPPERTASACGRWTARATSTRRRPRTRGPCASRRPARRRSRSPRSPTPGSTRTARTPTRATTAC